MMRRALDAPTPRPLEATGASVVVMVMVVPAVRIRQEVVSTVTAVGLSEPS